MSGGYPWPVPKERPDAGEAVNPEDINDASRPVQDTGGAVGEHMISNSLLSGGAALTREDNYPEGLYMGVFWEETDMVNALSVYNDSLPRSSVNVYMLPGRGWQLVEEWTFTLEHTADIVADGSVQLSSDTPSSTFTSDPDTHPVLSQAAAALSLDGVLCPDFADYGPDRSAEDFQMTQAQATQMWAPLPHGVWKDVPPGEHTISIKVNVDQGHYAPNFSQPVWAWSRSVFVKALYK